jgi:hypothetical protein
VRLIPSQSPGQISSNFGIRFNSHLILLAQQFDCKELKVLVYNAYLILDGAGQDNSTSQNSVLLRG